MFIFPSAYFIPALKGGFYGVAMKTRSTNSSPIATRPHFEASRKQSDKTQETSAVGGTPQRDEFIPSGESLEPEGGGMSAFGSAFSEGLAQMGDAPQTPPSPEEMACNAARANSGILGFNLSYSGLGDSEAFQRVGIEPRAWNAESGALYVDDGFSGPMPGTDTSHGVAVSQSARDHGYSGDILASDPASAWTSPNTAWPELERLGGPQLSQQEAQESLARFGSNTASDLLDSKTRMLDALGCDNVTGSAVNFSQGTSPANLMETIYKQLNPRLAEGETLSPEREGYIENLRNNLGTAFSFAGEDLNSEDAEVQAAAHQRLYQGLADTFGQALQSEDVRSAQADFSQAVEDFEANGNSVVISAGNWGQHAESFSNHAGAPINFPENFTENVLQADAATMVGATQWLNSGTERVAPYSNPGEIYAAGGLALGEPGVASSSGTSYAAPRVAAVMAELHQKFPDMSSSEIEEMVRRDYTHELATPNGVIQVLDYEKTYEFLRSAA